MDESPRLVAQFNHAFPFYVYAVFCVALLLVIMFLVPETKGRSLEDIAEFWLARRKKAPPRPLVQPAGARDE